MQEIDAVKAAFATFQGDFSTFSADVQAKLATLAANQTSAADKQSLVDIAAGLNGMDSVVKQLDASLNPAAPDPTQAP